MPEPFSPRIELPPEADIESPYSLFSLFISEELIALLSLNTNNYAKAKNAGQSGRDWHETTTAEIKIFLAILIYMGVHISPRDEDYWQVVGRACIVSDIRKCSQKWKFIIIKTTGKLLRNHSICHDGTWD
jgi:hypothetical protein